MEGQTFLRDGVMMVRVPDGREFRVSDVMRLNNPGMEYDDATGEAMAMAPPRGGGGSGTSRQYSFGDVGSETLARTIDDVSSTAGGGGEITRSLLPEDWQQTFPDAMLAAGDYGLAGLLGLLGAAETGAGYAGDVVEGAQGLLGIDSGYRPGGSARGFQRALISMAEGAGYAPEGRMIASLTEAGAPRAAARAVVDRLNQPGQMPTTYSNPIPGLMVGQHNLSPMGVQVADNIGGIPMPSLAIAPANAPLEKFGDVTLLTEPGMVLPSSSVNVWPNDAYTGRQPKGDVQFANEKTAREALKANPDFGHMRDATYWMDATNSMSDADEMMKTAQLGLAEGIDPKKYSSMWDYVRDVRAKLGYTAYEDAPKMPGFQAYVDTERVLYPKELYTQSGNRKKPQPYTLDTVMKRMGSDKAYTAGSEGWDYGPGSFRALVSPQFKTAAQVKAARGLLASQEEFKPVSEAFSNAYGTVKGDVEQYAKNSRLVYEAPEAMAEMGRGGSASWFGDVPDEVRGYIDELARTARTMPTEYFEAKPKVAYGLGDFPAALVPESAPQTADILRGAGVRDVLTYGPGTARAELIQRFPQLLFSAAGAGIPLGLLAMSPEEEQH